MLRVNMEGLFGDAAPQQLELKRKSALGRKRR
jgi:hypothetical protein